MTGIAANVGNGRTAVINESVQETLCLVAIATVGVSR